MIVVPMSVQDVLRDDAQAFSREEENITSELEKLDARVVDLRRRRDALRLRHVSSLAAAQALDSIGFRVERDSAGVINVYSDPATK